MGCAFARSAIGPPSEALFDRMLLVIVTDEIVPMSPAPPRYPRL
jgi:hypothetical protein